MIGLYRCCAVLVLSVCLVGIPAYGTELSSSSNAPVAHDEPIDAPGVASRPAYLGRPSGGYGPEFRSYLPAFAYAVAHPGSAPQGMSSAECTPSEGENPVVLIPGTNEDAFATYSALAPALAATGRCVYAFNHNPLQTAGRSWEPLAFAGDIRDTAAALARFVDEVRRDTGADKVDMVGHSQGAGPLPTEYIQRYGGEQYVERMVALSPPTRGVAPFNYDEVLAAVPGTRQLLEAGYKPINSSAWGQQVKGSDLLREQLAHGITRPGVKYTVIMSRTDRIVSVEDAQLDEPGVHNVVIQDVAPNSRPGHYDLPYDTDVRKVIVESLDS